LDIEFILNAEAKIIDNHTVEVEGKTYRAKNLVIATGARSNRLGIPGNNAKGIFTYESLVEDLDYEPGETVVVIGGSKVAIEYGCFFNATGRRTIIVARDKVLKLVNDDDTREYLTDMMKEQSVEILEESEVSEIEVDKNNHVQAVIINTKEGEVKIKTDFVFMGLGESPNSEMAISKLGLDADNKNFIKVNGHMQTSVPNVYAIGDVIGSPMEMFKARKGGMNAAKNIMGDSFEYFVKDYPDFMHTHIMRSLGSD
jgi:pyruvate/2-oxoglutarate dehydrogenase complex dihydrolipoamide dehydrogenase (E3) component